MHLVALEENTFLSSDILVLWWSKFINFELFGRLAFPMVYSKIWFLLLSSHLSLSDESDRDGRDRLYRDDRRSLSDYGRPSTDSYSGDADSYYSFADKPLSRGGQFGGREAQDVGYPHSKSECSSGRTIHVDQCDYIRIVYLIVSEVCAMLRLL